MTTLPSGTPDYLAGGSLAVDRVLALEGAVFRTFVLPRKHHLFGKVVPWEIEYSDLRGGYAQFGSLADVGNKVSASTLNHTFPDYLTLPHLVSVTNIAQNITTPYFGASLATGQLVIGTGTISGGCLFTETSDSNPTPVATTYDATGNITGIKDIVINGANSPTRIAILSDGAVIDVGTISGTTFTSAGTMHANTNPGWGLLTTPLNATTPGTQGLLIYAGTSLYFLASSAAYGDAPTATLTGIPGGGTDIGIERLSGMDYRAFWLWPKASRTSSMYGSITVARAEVWHTNLEGTDPLPAPLPLTSVAWAVIWNRKLAATDGYSIYTWDGERTENLHIFSQRDATSYSCRGLGVRDNVLYARVQKGSLANSTHWVEAYHPATNAWLPICNVVSAPNGTGVADAGELVFTDNELNYCPQIPISKQNGFLHLISRGAATPATPFNRVYQPPSGDNSFYTGQGIQSYAVSGIATGPVTTLPGLSAYPSIFSEIDLSGTDLVSGGVAATQAYMTMDLTNQPASTSPALSFTSPLTYTAYASDPLGKKVRVFDQNRSAWNRFQWRATLAQSSATTTKTPNGLPFKLRGYTFLDGIVRTPREIRGRPYR